MGGGVFNTKSSMIFFRNKLTHIEMFSNKLTCAVLNKLNVHLSVYLFNDAMTLMTWQLPCFVGELSKKKQTLTTMRFIEDMFLENMGLCLYISTFAMVLFRY